MLVDGAALGRYIAPQSGQSLLQPSPAIDNQELRLAQPALDEIVEDGAPSLAGLATHILDRQQHLLAVLAHPEHDQQHDRGGLAVEPDPHQSANRPVWCAAGKPAAPCSSIPWSCPRTCRALRAALRSPPGQRSP